MHPSLSQATLTAIVAAVNTVAGVGVRWLIPGRAARRWHDGPPPRTQVLREVEGIDLVAIAIPGGDPYGVAGNLEVLPDIDALIDQGIDIAVVAAPTRFHEDAALKLAAAGVHTRSIADTLEAGQRMVDAFAEAGLVGAVGHIERFNPALQDAPPDRGG